MSVGGNKESERVASLERSNEDFKLLTSFSHAYRAFWGLTKHVRGTLSSAFWLQDDLEPLLFLEQPERLSPLGEG